MLHSTGCIPWNASSSVETEVESLNGLFAVTVTAMGMPPPSRMGTHGLLHIQILLPLLMRYTSGQINQLARNFHVWMEQAVLHHVALEIVF